MSPIPFERFMDDALYGPAGFYMSGDSGAGRRHDFLTSPEVGPLFGTVLARFLDAEWTRLGRPDPFVVAEAGAGPGTLARTVIAARPACHAAMRYIAVEPSPGQRERHPAGVESQAELPSSPFTGVIIANELLDNLPFRLAVHDGRWREALVDAASDGRFLELLSAPLDPLPGVLPVRAPHGARAPLQERAAAWVTDARSRLASGTLVVFDYTSPTTGALAVRPWRDWLRTYRGHQRGGHYLDQPGTQDITADVCIDQLPEPDTLRTQAQWLQLYGISELVDEGRAYWEANAARPDVAAMRMRSRASEAAALLDPDGLGGFTVLEWRATLVEVDENRAVSTEDDGQPT